MLSGHRLQRARPKRSLGFAMTLDIRLLKAFIMVCEKGSITRAAESLFVSQSALTRRIQELEAFYGMPLLKRGKRGVEATEAGCHLLVRAKEIVGLADRTKRELEADAGRLGGIVRIGAVETNALPLVAEWLRDWRALRPKATFELYAADGDDIRELLDVGRLDVGFLIEPIETARYETAPLPVSERWGVLMRREEALAKKPSLRVDELAALPLILPRRHIVREVLTSWFGAAADSLNIVGWHNVPTNSLSLVRCGIGAFLCVEGAVERQARDDLAFVPLEPERRSSEVMVRRRNRPLSRSAEDFWKMCLAKCGEASKQ